MIRPIALLAFALACATPLPAVAGAADYAFELVTSDLQKGDETPLRVRLLNKKTGKPVEGAVIIRSRLDMAPDGMAEHATAIKPAPSAEPGVYAFKADLSMEGRWQLSLAAKVQGEPETVVGKVIVKVNR
jgi:hypothetical protein